MIVHTRNHRVPITLAVGVDSISFHSAQASKALKKMTKEKETNIGCFKLLINISLYNMTTV